jgi:hypothetical protein
MIKRGVLSALLLAAAAQGFVFPLGRSASKAPTAAGRAAGQCSPSFGERVAVQPLRMSASTAEPPAKEEKETFEFQAEVSRYVRACVMGDRLSPTKHREAWPSI